MCKESKWKSFYLFVEDLTYNTPCGTVWKKIKSLKVGNNGENIPSEVQGTRKKQAYLQKTSQCGNSW